MWTRFSSDERGAFAIITAIALVVIIMVVGLSIDIGRGTRTQSIAQQASDAASAACTLKYWETKDVAAAQDAGFRYLAANLDPAYMGGMSGTKKSATVEFNEREKSCLVTLKGDIPTSFTRVAGFEKVDISNVSEASIRPGPTATKVFFVLDRSGSMNVINNQCGPEKFEAVRIGAAKAINIIYDSIASDENLRTGTVFFNTEVGPLADLQQDRQPSLKVIEASVAQECSADTICDAPEMQQRIYRDSDLEAQPTICFTNTAGGLQKAIERIDANTELEEKAKDLVEIIVLMSDGAPNLGPGKTLINESIAACNAFKNAPERKTKNGGKVIRHLITVVYNAPDEASKNFMKECASKPEFYFEVMREQELIAAFENIADMIRKLIDIVRLTK